MKSRQTFKILMLILTFAVGACTAADSGTDISSTQDPGNEEGVVEPGEVRSTSEPGSDTDREPQQVESGTRAKATSVSVEDMLAPTPVPTLESGQWMTLPVIPQLTERALEIYAEGIRLGNDPHTFSKVGDCQNVPSMFVSIYDYPGFYTLGEQYEYLSETIEWYQGSFKYESEAVRRGFNAASVVSPVWADPEACEIGEDPLACELRTHNPSVAIVSLETWWAGNPENYEKYVRQILERLIEAGVLPILATKADNQEGDHHINEILASLAYEYQIPLWNFWLAVQPLPNQGLMEDGFHLTFAPNHFDDPLVMEAAWPWRNLTALQVLHEVRLAVQDIR